MKTVEKQSSTGGLITEFYDEAGNRVKVVHSAGKAYSGKVAEQEAKKSRKD